MVWPTWLRPMYTIQTNMHILPPMYRKRDAQTHLCTRFIWREWKREKKCFSSIFFGTITFLTIWSICLSDILSSVLRFLVWKKYLTLELNWDGHLWVWFNAVRIRNQSFNLHTHLTRRWIKIKTILFLLLQTIQRNKKKWIGEKAKKNQSVIWCWIDKKRAHAIRYKWEDVNDDDICNMFNVTH